MIGLMGVTGEIGGLTYYKAVKKGEYEFVSDAVERILGRLPLNLEQYLMD